MNKGSDQTKLTLLMQEQCRHLDHSEKKLTVAFYWRPHHSSMRTKSDNLIQEESVKNMKFVLKEKLNVKMLFKQRIGNVLIVCYFTKSLSF